MEDYIKSTELWIETMKVQITQKQSNLDHIGCQIFLWQEEQKLLTKQIEHDLKWLEESKKEFENYKKDSAV